MKRHAKPSVTHKPIHKVNLPVKMRYFLTCTIYPDVFTVFRTVFMGRRRQGPPATLPVLTLDFRAGRYELSRGSVAKHAWAEVNFVCVTKLLRGRKLSWHEIRPYDELWRFSHSGQVNIRLFNRMPRFKKSGLT